MSDYKSPIKIRRELTKEELDKFSEAMKTMGSNFVTLTTSLNEITWIKLKQRIPRKLKKKLKQHR